MGITKSYYDPLRATASHCEPLRATASHCKPLRATASHCETLRPTASHCEPLRATASHCGPLRATASHCEPLRATAIHCEPLRATASHCEPLRATASHCEPLRPHCLLKNMCTAFFVLYSTPFREPLITITHIYSVIMPVSHVDLKARFKSCGKICIIHSNSTSSWTCAAPYRKLCFTIRQEISYKLCFLHDIHNSHIFKANHHTQL